MDKDQAAAAAAPGKEEKEVAIETASKELIYEKLGEEIRAMTDKRVGKAGGRKLFDSVVEQIFAAAAKNGVFRFNGGFGSIHKRTYQAGERRLPAGQTVQFGERQKLRYEEGVVVEALVANGGDLTEALKARGSRAPATTETPAAATGADAKLD